MSNQSWTLTGPQTIEVDGVTTLAAHVVDGRLDVVAHDEPVTRVEVHSVDGRPIEVRFDGGRLVVGHESARSGWQGFLNQFKDFGGRARADLHVAVPRHVAVRLGTVRGEGLLAGTTGGAKVSTVSGSLLVSRTQGALKVSNVSGDVTVREHTGDLTTSTVSGDVTVTAASAEVTSSSVSGDVTIDLTTQPSYVKTSTVSGNLLLRLPDTAAVDLSVSAVSGRVQMGGLDVSGHGDREVRAQGPGATRLRASTVSGNVTVLGAPVGGHGPTADAPVYGTPAPAAAPGRGADDEDAV